MSTPGEPKPAKPVIGLFMHDKALLAPAVSALTNLLGPIDMVGPWFDFDFTDYYHAEMGRPLFRRMFAFKTLIRQEDLPDIKLKTNEIEACYQDDGKRSINIDPGYLLYERFVLATGKNYSHRIYIGKGIYADLTLMYHNGAYRTLPWTYPDYADGKMTAFLEGVRRKYAVDLKRSTVRIN